jgi:hypothetical protein
VRAFGGSLAWGTAIAAPLAGGWVILALNKCGSLPRLHKLAPTCLPQPPACNTAGLASSFSGQRMAKARTKGALKALPAMVNSEVSSRKDMVRVCS